MWVTWMGKRDCWLQRGGGFFTQCWLKATGEMNSSDVGLDLSWGAVVAPVPLQCYSMWWWCWEGKVGAKALMNSTFCVFVEYPDAHRLWLTLEVKWRDFIYRENQWLLTIAAMWFVSLIFRGLGNKSGRTNVLFFGHCSRARKTCVQFASEIHLLYKSGQAT